MNNAFSGTNDAVLREHLRLAARGPVSANTPVLRIVLSEISASPTSLLLAMECMRYRLTRTVCAKFALADIRSFASSETGSANCQATTRHVRATKDLAILFDHLYVRQTQR